MQMPDNTPIYLDHAATTAVREEVREAMRPYESERFGNPSSSHRWGRQARGALEESRERLAAAIGARRTEIVFTGGGTEADNLAVLGAWRSHGGPGRWIACSAIEHSAVRGAIECAAGEGAGTQTIGVDAEGVVDQGAVDEMLRLPTVLVAVMWVNNEVGSVQPVERIAATCAARGVLFHTDAVQAFGRTQVRVDRVACDTLALSAHKIGGPKGLGCLFVRSGVELEPLSRGGGQEAGLRPGTQNVAAAVGFARAAELAVGELESECARLRALRDLLEVELRRHCPNLIVNAAGVERAPHVVNVSVPNLEPDALVIGLDLEGVAASAGSACHSGSHEPSHVLTAMGRTVEGEAAARLSLGHSTSEADVRTAAERFGRVVRRLRSTPPLVGVTG
ncbi:MAG TPA: cysteine desulfurase family protein [Longimicrobiales bacterium]|nr:cysteine desulfurase family protein [Longimicrobiales bacterium]